MIRRSVIALLIAVSLAPTSALADAPTCHITQSGNTVTAADCPEDSHIATYRYKDGAPGPDQFETSLPQKLSNQGNKTATTPDCFWQADVYTGETLSVIDANHQYGDRLLAARHGGTQACSTTPPPETPPEAPQAPQTLPAEVVAAPAAQPVAVTPKLTG